MVLNNGSDLGAFYLYILKTLHSLGCFYAKRILLLLCNIRISKVIEVGEDSDSGAFYLVLELVDGMDLSCFLRHVNSRLSSTLVSLVATDIARALEYAHGHEQLSPDWVMRRGVIHRDISPSNMLLSSNGEVKLTDFGIAKELRSEESKTTTGFKGKLAYMSPEQLRAEVLDERSDLFSLGITLYECLTSTRPFDAGSDVETVNSTLRGNKKNLSELCDSSVSNMMVESIEWLLEPNRLKRCPSAKALLEKMGKVSPTLHSRRELSNLLVLVTQSSRLLRSKSPIDSA